VSHIWRAVIASVYLLLAGIYVLFVAGAVPPIWDVMLQMDAVKGGPFWEITKQLKWVGTYAVPAILILTPILYWIVGGVQEERNRRQYPR